MRDQFVETDGVLLDELLVIEFFLDDDVDHRQGHCAVGAGPDLQVHVGLIGQGDALGVDDHQLGPFCQVLFQGQLQGKIGGIRVVAPEDIELGVEFLGRVLAKGDLSGPDAHPVADALHREEVGRSEGRLEPLGEPGHLQGSRPRWNR